MTDVHPSFETPPLIEVALGAHVAVPHAAEPDPEWARVTDRLLNWGSKRWDEDDFVPPTAAALGIAGRVAALLQRNGWPAPPRVAPNGEGGIGFFWPGTPNYLEIEISDGAAQFELFIDNRMVASGPIQVEPK